MSWAPPDHVPQAQIQSYHVYLDGQLKATIRGNDRTKALLEKVDLTHVRAIIFTLSIHLSFSFFFVIATFCYGHFYSC